MPKIKSSPFIECLPCRKRNFCCLSWAGLVLVCLFFLHMASLCCVDCCPSDFSLFPLLVAAIMNIVLSQPCGKIFVGDPHQQIYTFRGAVNALFTVPHTHVFYLTQVSACTYLQALAHISKQSVFPLSFLNVPALWKGYFVFHK